MESGKYVRIPTDDGDDGDESNRSNSSVSDSYSSDDEESRASELSPRTETVNIGEPYGEDVNTGVTANDALNTNADPRKVSIPETANPEAANINARMDIF